MSSPLPARRGRDGSTRATGGQPAAGASQRGHEPTGPMGREVEQAPGAGPRVSASELGGRSVPARTAGRGADASTPGPRSSGGRAERTRAALCSPAALRQAILIREILGPPAALQTGHRDVPGLPGH